MIDPSAFSTIAVFVEDGDDKRAAGSVSEPADRPTSHAAAEQADGGHLSYASRSRRQVVLGVLERAGAGRLSRPDRGTGGAAVCR